MRRFPATVLRAGETRDDGQRCRSRGGWPAGRAIETMIPRRLDRLPWSRWHWIVVVGLGITWILDGFEVTLVGALASVLTKKDTLHLSTHQASSVGSRASWRAGSGSTNHPLMPLDLERLRFPVKVGVPGKSVPAATPLAGGKRLRQQAETGTEPDGVGGTSQCFLMQSVPMSAAPTTGCSTRQPTRAEKNSGKTGVE
jgi:hypothetical protein